MEESKQVWHNSGVLQTFLFILGKKSASFRVHRKCVSQVLKQLESKRRKLRNKSQLH